MWCYTFYQLVKKLIFLIIIRLDIFYVVSIVSIFISRPEETNLDAIKYILLYIKYTMDYGILYQKMWPCTIKKFTNVDWDSCSKIQCSVDAYIIDKGPISWQNKP